MQKYATLCISDIEDVHIPYVQRHLTSELTTIFALSRSEGLSYVFKKEKLTATYDGHALKQIRSVWYRKPEIYPQHINVTPGYEKYVLSSLRTHADALLPLLANAFWVSDYYAILRAGSKPYQQAEAQKLGFIIPDTLATSDSKAAKDFIAKHNNVVVKGQMSQLPWRGPDVLDFPTTLVRKGQEVKLDGLHLAPAIFQQAIDVDFELRITVVGKKVFAASIRDRRTKDMPENVRDWRMNYMREGLTFEPHTLSRDVTDQCRDLVKQLGLQFGAIDLIVDKKGKTWFLEINPNGQWAFIEDDTGLPIGKAIAELLERG